VLRQAAGVLGKLLMSLAVVTLFFFISARMPFFNTNTPLQLQVLTPQSGTSDVTTTAPAMLTLESGEARFSGDFFSGEGQGGFTMQEIDVTGPCGNAGKRYLAASCSDCTSVPAVSGSDEPATLLWTRTGDNAAMGTIFRDCTAILESGQVRVALLSFQQDRVYLAAKANNRSKAEIPILGDSERVSNMNLGNWSITVDAVSGGQSALQRMQALLADSGWREAPQGQQQLAKMQRVLTRGDSRLCVITLNESDGEYQLVTMMNI
jgi:hypothetical protein